MDTILRKTTINDLPVLEKLEQNCFPPFQQSPKRVLRHSILSPSQEVWVAETTGNGETKIIGSVILHLHPRTLRLYSICVLPEYQGLGVGLKLLNHIRKLADGKGYSKISLEARENDEKLVSWYKKWGFTVTEHLPDYYTEGEHAVKMVSSSAESLRKQAISNIIVVRNPATWKLKIEGVSVVSSKNYVTDPEFQTLKNARIFNLCNSYKYQKLGYYVSLLATARDHRPIPNNTTMQDFTSTAVVRSISEYIDDTIQKSLKHVDEKKFTLNIYFGQSVSHKFKGLAQKLYSLFEAPLLRIEFSKTDKWIIQKVTPLSFQKVDPDDMEYIQLFAQNYFAKKRFNRPRFKNFRYDLAILVNPNEENPPSCPEALQNFKKAAEKAGFYTEFITKEDYHQLTEYDALFIRETTSVNNHTYQFSRTAYAEGLVVIDDPWSILRCSNKIFLNERMKQNKITTPETEILVKSTFKQNKQLSLKFPLVLKQPDSAFSLGVEKINNETELNTALEKLFTSSDLVVAQEFLPSEYDWRIGVLGQAPLFACKYFMAENHWQIYDWNSPNTNKSGDWETVPLNLVPEKVLSVAVKAASLIGDGLYGVDLKMINGEVYVIEVNDNPNIDAGVEDMVLKDELYDKIMQSLLSRIEVNRNIAQFVTV